jgi:para-nitrobenzyl esterase
MQINEPHDEDCLYLNIWTPGWQGKRPVMVWIHGGGLNIGAGSQEIYDGQHIARRGDVVVVTINYRLGPLGFVHLDQITKGAIPATGNEGLLDQVEALRWVRDNISAFGGDPDNVTIFGQSGGGWAVNALLAMPTARGLFHKAIPQSGTGNCIYTLEQATRLIAKPMIEALGVDPTDARALRSMTPVQLLEACPTLIKGAMTGQDPGSQPWPIPRTVIDGTVLPDYPIKAVTSGAAKDIPILTGICRDDNTYYGIIIDPTITDADIVDSLEQKAPGIPYERLVKVYREARQARLARADAASIYGTIMTHRMMWIPTTRMLDAQQAHGPVYQYIFEWIAPEGDGAFGSRHAIDVCLAFGTHTLNDFTTAASGRGPAADALSAAWIDALVAFARNGDPSTDSLGEWRPYSENRATMLIGEWTRLVEAPFEEERRAWDGVPDERFHF